MAETTAINEIAQTKESIGFIDKIKNKMQLFWILQLIGWGTYGLARFLLNFFTNNVSGGVSEIGRFMFLVFGVGLSIGLYYYYNRFWKKSPNIFLIVITIVSASTVAALIWLFLCELFIIQANIFEFIAELKTTWAIHLQYLFSMSVVMVAWSGIYFGVKYWQDLQKQKELTLKASSLAHQAQLQMLRYQLNPHFLFNSLNSISTLVHKDPDKAERMLEELSDFLRYTLIKDEVSNVPLKEEIEVIQSYLAIEKIRFQEKLLIEYDIDKIVHEFKVPGFIVHPLVENAVKYGMKTSSKPLRINLSAKKENGKVKITVSNSGKWIEREEGEVNGMSGTKTGLKNIKQRLHQSFPDKSKFDVFEKDGWVHSMIVFEKDLSPT